MSQSQYWCLARAVALSIPSFQFMFLLCYICAYMRLCPSHLLCCTYVYVNVVASVMFACIFGSRVVYYIAGIMLSVNTCIHCQEIVYYVERYCAYLMSKNRVLYCTYVTPNVISSTACMSICQYLFQGSRHSRILPR